jgi:hypothetical protein
MVVPATLTRKLSIKALQYGSRWDTLIPRPDRLLSRQDGSFCFLDLPEGTYTVTASMPGAGSRYGTASAETTVAIPAAASSAASVAEGASSPATGTSSAEAPAALPALLELRLPPTSLQGVVQTMIDEEAGPVWLATLRVKGSGEAATSDSEGRFALNGLEPGARTLLVSAQGYRSASMSVQLEQGNVTSVSVALEPESALQT